MKTKILVSRLLVSLAVAFALGADVTVRAAENAPLAGGGVRVPASGSDTSRLPTLPRRASAE